MTIHLNNPKVKEERVDKIKKSFSNCTVTKQNDFNISLDELRDLTRNDNHTKKNESFETTHKEAKAMSKQGRKFKIEENDLKGCQNMVKPETKLSEIAKSVEDKLEYRKPVEYSTPN